MCEPVKPGPKVFHLDSFGEEKELPKLLDEQKKADVTDDLLDFNLPDVPVPLTPITPSSIGVSGTRHCKRRQGCRS